VAAGQAPSGEVFRPACATHPWVLKVYDFPQLELDLRPTIVHADIVKKREAHVTALRALSEPAE
jgi:hypothetical protein